jgi:putative transposase
MHKVKRRFRFYPSEAQKVELSKVFGCVRYVYNTSLDWRKTEFEAGRKPSYNKNSSWLTSFKREKEFLNDVSCVPLQQSLRHLQTAYQRFFKKQSGFPSFKSRDHRQSCEFTERAFSYKNGQLSLSKIGRLDVVWTLSLKAKPTTVTVIKEPSGKYFVTLTLLEADKALPPSITSVGIDLGIETFATLSDGRKFKSPAKIRKLRKKLAALQRKHSRRQKGSKRREKARVKVARLHEHIANVRNDFLQKLSTLIVRENQTIAIEDLHTKGMMKNRKLARAIGEQGWRQFREMLKYKCEWGGRKLEIVSRWLPSSKTCSCCGEKTTLTLKDRSWTCACGATHDRDVNAAQNILAAGQAVIARGGSVRPARTYVLKARPAKREPLNC